MTTNPWLDNLIATDDDEDDTPTWATPAPVVAVPDAPVIPVQAPVALPVTPTTQPVLPTQPTRPAPLPVTPAPVLPVAKPALAPLAPTPAAPAAAPAAHLLPVIEEQDQAAEEEEAGVGEPEDMSTSVDTTPVTSATPVAPAPVPVPVMPESVGSIRDLTTDDEWDTDAIHAALAAEAAQAAAVEAKKTADRERLTRALRPIAVTGRDVAILQFLGRYRMATYPQIAEAFNMTYAAVRHRMPRLAREGLVVRKTVGQSTFSVCLPTDAGMRLASLDLPTPTLSWATAAHTLGLVDIGIRMEALGETVVTEREIRAADTRDQPTDRMLHALTTHGLDDYTTEDGNETGTRPHLYVVAMGAQAASAYAHIPDMVLIRPIENGHPQSVAIELELVHKPQGQWKKILTAYKNAPHIGQVVYYTQSPKILNGVLTAAQATGTAHLVKVRRFTPSQDTAIPLP